MSNTPGEDKASENYRGKNLCRLIGNGILNGGRKWNRNDYAYSCVVRVHYNGKSRSWIAQMVSA
jgi:hypothetical protein